VLLQLQRLAEAVLSTPAAAMGVLHHIGTAISRKSYWRETYRVLAAPAYLSLLSIVVARHPLMHAEVDASPFHPCASHA
jgi:TH1 protein